MVKRIASTALWFFALGTASEYATLIAGVPPLLGLVIAGAISAFVGLDPFHLLWTVQRESTDAVRSASVHPHRVVRSQA
jgi:hypothetical protein